MSTTTAPHPRRRSTRSTRVPMVSTKAPTGITGFDEITGGGLPQTPKRLISNFETFGWDLTGLQPLVDEMSGTTDGRTPLHISTLADIYTAGGEVLMGTLRWERESAERMASEVAEVAGKLKRVSLDAEEAVLEVRAKSLQTELVAKKVEKTLLTRTTESRQQEHARGHTRMRTLRGADAAVPDRPRSPR